MSTIIHIVEEQPGVSIHREIPAKRPAVNFDVREISPVTREAYKRICGVVPEPATPDDYRHVFESILGRAVVDEILK